MKLNPTKCSFGVAAGKFLGYMVTQRGIEANPDQIRSIMNIQSPTSIRDVQRLTGRVAALSRFISRSSEKCHLFFSTLRKSKDFDWTPACEQALQDLKRYLTSPPLLSKPKDGEHLYIYLAVSEGAVSAVLVREEEGKQFPVYYVSKSLLDAETRYTQLEKLALALVTAARKLRPYFQCHPITVYTTYPLKSILHKPELSGRLTKWTVELSEYDITFQPRTALKSQVLADFVADFAPNVTQQADKELLNLTERSNSKWTLTVDGSSNVNGAGIGLVLTSPEGDLIQQAIRCGFKATNNEAEYEALIAGLNLAKDMGIKKLSIRSDSQLVVNQLLGSYQARDLKMASYLEHVKILQPAFDEFDISQIPRVDNSHADALANLGSSIPATESQLIPLLYLQWPAVWKDPPAEVTTIDASDSWMTPIVSYLTSDELPEDRNEARRLQAKAARFTIHDGKLLKRSFSGPYLRCVTPVEASHILSELHDGECGNHSGGCSLTNRALTAGYYWPTMRSDSTSHVKRCDSCQRFTAVSHLPPEQLSASEGRWLSHRPL
ncbi:hypothetical protein UlMin_007011 [Ulmus minor]